VLVVDDDADLRLLVRGLLTPAGYDVLEASTAADALETVAQRRPALALLDVRLPDVSGYEICRRLRDDFGDTIAIVFLSGDRTADYDRTAGLLLGADDYIVKPFAGGELIARIRRAIDRAPAPATRAYRLTKRELEVLKLLSEGLGEKKIAERLVITRKTVATHLQRVLLKLGVHSRAEAVAFAHRNRLFVDR
jgi:DNA-binding NarL/FixJ family response regulator